MKMMATIESTRKGSGKMMKKKICITYKFEMESREIQQQSTINLLPIRYESSGTHWCCSKTGA